MIVLVLAMAKLRSIAMGFTGIPRDLALWIEGLSLSHYTLLAVLAVIFIVLGGFLDGISIVVRTAAIILPMIQAAGIDLIWFGIFAGVIVEMSTITPPVGFDLSVLQGMSNRPLGEIVAGTAPFFLLLGLALVIITVFPNSFCCPSS